MKKIAFTLCSNNYIPQAKLLIDSFLQHNHDYLFILGLVDEKKAGLNYSFGTNVKIVACSEVLPAAILKHMSRQYKIVELNTAVKPFYFRYLFENFVEAEHIIYLDPDIYVYHSFQYIENCLHESDIILTPHASTPVPLDGKKPDERSYLKYGIFNLGFLAVTRSENTDIFLRWLAERLYDYCYMEINLGMYVDQLWINHVPIYFNKVFITRHPGLNCAYWNLHERYFYFNKNSYFVNETFQLIFFHFSALDVDDTNNISGSQNRYSLNDRPDLSSLINQYAQKLKNARADGTYNVRCVYTPQNIFQKLLYYKKRFILRKTKVV